MTVEQFGNGGYTYLTSSITTTPSTGTIENWSVNDTSSFSQSTGQVRALVDSELVIVTVPPTSSTTLQVSRAAEGTTAATHNIGAGITQVLTAGAMDQLLNLSQTASQSMVGPLSVPTLTIPTGEFLGLIETSASNPSVNQPVTVQTAGGTFTLPALQQGLRLIIKNASSATATTVSGAATIDGSASRGIPPFGYLDVIGGISQWWVIGGTTYGHPVSQMYMASTTVTIPVGGMYTYFLLGGGGGGAGGGSALTSGGVTGQVGGGGGGQGQTIQSMSMTAVAAALTLTVGAGGTGGAGGAANGNPGVSGIDGSNSTITGAITLTAIGGTAGLHGGGNSTNTVGGGAYGSGSSTNYFPTSPNGAPGCGGSANSSSGSGGGVAVGVPGWTGGGGGPASATLGGQAGTINGNTQSGNTASTTGGNGANQAANSGLGGPGGGGGAPGGAGGNGGNGGSGFIMIMLNP